MGQAYLGLNQIDKCLEHFQLAYNESVTKLGFDHKSTKEVGKQINLTRQRQRYENNKEQQLIQKQIPYHNNKRVIKKTSKAQNYQPDKIVEQDQELKLNYNENLTSNLQTFLVEFSKNKNENSQDIKILCCNLINEFFDYAEVDIEIKISNVNQNQVDHIQQEYKDLNISINRSGQKQKPNQTDTNSNQKVYTMQEQTGNNISSKQKMVYIQEEVVSEYIVEALQKDIQFKLDDQSYQYIIRPKFSLNQTESNKFFDKFKNRLDHTIILTYNLQSHVEASQILNILNYQSIQQKLCQSLNLKEIIVFLSSNICLNNFEYYPELKKQAEILKQNSTQIILLAQRDLKDKIYQIQQQFNQFVQNSRKYQLNNDLFEIVLENKPDLKVIQSKVKQLQEEVGNFNIIIKEPIVKIESNKNYVFQAEMEQLNDENIKICQIQQNFQKMKEQILKIFFPCLELKIFDRNKIKLWNNFLNQYHNDDEKENWSIQQELNLRIKGEQDLINKKEQIIIQDLNNYQFQSIYFNSQEKILQVIKNKQKFDELYKQTFVKISQKFGKCLIKIVDIDIKGLKFKVEVYFDNQIEISQISQQLQEQFFDQLNIYQEDIEILDILSFLRKTKRQFQEEYQIVVSKMNREYCFIGNNENLNQIKQLLVQIKQSKKEKIIKECIKCPNQIIFNSLKQQQNDQGLFDNKDIQINYLRDFNITLCSLNQQIIKNKCENLSTEMKQLEQRIQKKLYIFQEKRTKFIEKNLKDFCKNNLEEENNIFIKFQKNYYKIISELELGNKLLQILHADIKQLECDAIVNFSNHPNTSLRQLVNQILEFGGYF
ncbi:unnamed protein product [Paramecium sonneborni]|uniref:Uncharacterized protein n=1 Tax=Paramecium sonneborni TaxID=65129 RepID=A0A8S1R124_9CILI|nr:unnamed protein product [Paramecium sonneborni]